MWSPWMELRLCSKWFHRLSPLTNLWIPSIPKDNLKSSDVLKMRRTTTWLENAAVSSGSDLWKGKCCLEQSLIIFHLSVRQAMSSPLSPAPSQRLQAARHFVLKKSTLTNQCQGLPSPEYLPPKLSVLACCVWLPWSCFKSFLLV